MEAPTVEPSDLELVRLARAGDPSAMERIVLVGNRGMITEARIRQDLAPAQIDWISALRSSPIKWLLESGPLRASW